MPKKKTYAYPEPSTAQMVQEAAKKHGIEMDMLRSLFDLEEGGVDRWFSGRRQPPSPAFSNGFREAFELMPSINQVEFMHTWKRERELPPPSPLKQLRDEDKDAR